ncbi:MAG: peptidyl-prolyl cis-trans isomerase [Candidatus Omnitrophica bacterium]|nr:peptidyl-prolyl cis-trans isomerase [Candidatus Omnitrophota bacterium]
MKIVCRMIHVMMLLSFLCVAVPSSWAVVDAIIAIVNDELITLKDLKDYLRNTFVSLNAEGMPERKIRAIMADLEKDGIRSLIEDKLILSRANEMGLEVSEKAIAGRLAKIKEKYPSEEEFLKGLIDNGASVTDLRNKITEQLKIKYVVEHEVRSKIYVNPQEVTNYYEQNRQQFKRKERINLDSIFISLVEGKKRAREKAQQAYDLIESGKDFLEVARVYSDAPSIGVIEKGQLILEIERVIFGLKDSQLSEIIEVDAGFYILKLRGRIASQIAGLLEVKKEIYDYIYEEKFKRNLTRWLAQLKAEAFIDIKEQ